jgi:D-alanine-D-alanine ligase
VDENSLCIDDASRIKKCHSIFDDYAPLLVEEYIDGREFTVLVIRKADNSIEAYDPVEYVFPHGAAFKTYALKTSELHPDCNVRVADVELSKKLKDAAVKIFSGFGGVGYARLDFRSNNKGDIYFLEINFTCSVFYSDGYEGSADFILKASGVAAGQFLKDIISEGISRHFKNKKPYNLRGDSISGYGIYANRDILKDEVVFRGEERPQRIATRAHIASKWNDDEKENFKKYAYPISEHVYLLWDENPSSWGPQNHCCEANTHYKGLDVVASRDISKGEELTLDYGAFLDEAMQPFQCSCGKPACRGLITGISGNSISYRESIRK